MIVILMALLQGLGVFQAVSAQNPTYTELYRPQYHFTPPKHFMNDPNGLLYYKGIYHLFYQYDPNGSATSWGHATSSDLTHWEQQPIALLARGYPTNVTELFWSGSAVADVDNTSGFGHNGKIPLVAMYTSNYKYAQTLPSGKKVQKNQQSQSIAYSLDDGMTWTTYDAVNPVILDPPTAYSDQSLNFRDPYIFWHKPTKKWIAVLSLPVLHKLLIYTSKDLKDWAVASEFGPVNAVGGAWECPNLFPLPVDGNDANVKWVVMVGLNPGGPPGTIGSGTQYVVGNFDGTTFIADTDSISVDQTSFSNSSAPSQVANWVDWGPDFYAAQVYNGLPSDEHVAIGWMNNWQYASLIPTDPWCGAMSTPRKFSLKRINGKATLVQDPTENWGSLVSHKGLDQSWSSVTGGTKSLGDVGKALQVELSFSDRAPAVSGSSQFGIIVRATPDLKEQTRVGYDFSTKRLFIDRTQSGNVSFDDTFADTYYAPLAADAKGKINMRIYVDWSSVEVFGGQGETTITAQIFPSNNATYAQIFSVGGDTQHVKVGINQVSSAWTIR